MGFKKWLNVGMFVLENLNEYQKCNKTYTKQEVDKRYLAGEEGEEIIKDLVSHQDFGSKRGCLCLKDRRVPIVNGKGKREIDFIIVTDNKINVVEVKNWSGRIVGRIRDRSWTVYSQNGSRRDVCNLVKDNSKKAKVLVDFLQANGFNISNGDVDHYVFFVNTRRPDGSVRLELDYDLSNSNRIVTTDTLKKNFNFGENSNTKPDQSLSAAILSLIETLVEFFLKTESFAPVFDSLLHRVGRANHVDLRKTLERLPTWDQITYFGGKKMRGDIFDHYNSKYVEDLFLDHQHVDPNNILEINNEKMVRESNGALDAFTSLAHGFFAGGMPLEIIPIRNKSQNNLFRGNPDGVIRFKAAGSPDVSNISILDITRIIYGNRFANRDWLFNKV